jgi:hypothetical protein
VPRTAGQDVRLAHALTPAEQIDTLMEMADDLRGEAVRLADPRSGAPGSADELALLAELYGQVVRRGIGGRARVLPREARLALVPSLVQRLQRTEKDLTVLSENLLPARAHYLQPISRSAQEVAVQLREEPKAPPGHPEAINWTGARPLLATLVLAGLRLAEEPDPLRRAEVASDLAQQLALTVALVSAEDDSQQVAELGSTLGHLMEQGVAGNLDRAEEADPKGSRRAEAEQVRQRAAQATATLERNLAHAPPAARAGLQRALEASEQAWNRKDNGKAKGKGASGAPGHAPFIPPGLRKKMQADPSGAP